MVTILMTSAKLATPGRRKIKIFWNKVNDIIIIDYDVSNNILLRDSNYIVDAVMWSKFGKYSICDKSYHNLNFIRIWPEKPLFLKGGLGSS